MGSNINSPWLVQCLADEREMNFILLRRSAQRAQTQLNIGLTSVFIATKVIHSQCQSYNYVSIYFGSMRGQISLIFSRLLEFLVILSYTPLWWAVAVWILSDEARLTSYPTRDLYSSKTKTKESASYFRYPCGNVYCIHDFQDFIRFFIFSNLPYGSFMSFNQYLTAFTKNQHTRELISARNT